METRERGRESGGWGVGEGGHRNLAGWWVL